MPVRDDIRSRIFEIVFKSRWATQELPGGLEGAARVIGVDPHLLGEVRIARRLSGKKIDGQEKLRFAMPVEMRKHLPGLGKKKQTTGKGLVRSLLHCYLLQDSWDPRYHEIWELDGKRVLIRKSVFTVDVKKGLLEALEERAKSIGFSRPQLIRSLVMEYLMGNIPFDLPPIAKGQTFANPKGYCLKGPGAQQ